MVLNHFYTDIMIKNNKINKIFKVSTLENM